ncbi:MAG: FAD-dependent oxidoreductase [Candidatus Aenigmarchaeota archaeon]|nr:FAD-dependent oxidoreductase [Candidatus Aenigmarchaeota archaeon]
MSSVIQIYDSIIIGSGPTGLGAAMYAGRMNMKTLVIGDLHGGIITTTDVVENYPGFIRLTGLELADKLQQHAEDYKKNVELLEDRVTEVKKEKDHFLVKTKEKSFETKTVIFATGTKYRELKVPGHDQFKNKGVHYCGLCDGFFYKDKTVGVVGGSDSAAKEALLMTQWAKKVFMIYRGEKIRPEPINMKRIEQNVKIEIITKTNVTEIKGEKTVKSVVLDNPYKGKKELELDGLFIAIGLIPLSDLAKTLGAKINNKGEIEINRESKTNIPGVYAAGDITDTKFKQAITGVAEGVHAVYSAYTYINEKDVVQPT